MDTREGFVWSLMSTTEGGFVEGGYVTNVRDVGNGICKGDLEYRIGETKDYEFFEEQFVPISNDIWSPANLSNDADHIYKEGTQVKVYARQVWGEVMETPILGRVYQTQFRSPHYGKSGSVIVSVDPRNFKNRRINAKGGATIEVYPQQLKKHYHGNKYPTVSSPEMKYESHKGGFALHRMFRHRSFFNFKNIFS